MRVFSRSVRLLAMFILAGLAFPQALFAFDTDLLIPDGGLTDISIPKVNLNSLLSRGALSKLVLPDITGVSRPVSEIIWNASREFSLNPQFLITLLQKEQSLVEDDNPAQDQLDWAMGYAICDTCSKDDPLIQKYRGFGKQVYFASKRIREVFLSDLERRGYTESGIGPGIPVTIDNRIVIPKNFATAVLYTYTPHLKGNENFAKIWDAWFNQELIDGSLLKDKTTGDIWLIQNGLRRPIVSQSALYSRFNTNSIVTVETSALDEYQMGEPIQFPNYSLLRSPRGTVYLIVNDERRGFTSQEAFRTFGFSPDEIIDVTWDELNVYKEGKPITTSSVYPQGTLLQDKQTGGVYLVQNGIKHPIISKEVLQANFPTPVITQVSRKNLDEYETGTPLLFPDGTLVAVKGSPDIFVISDGMRRHISDEATFITYGWSWNKVVWTNEKSVLIHQLGKTLNTDLKNEELQVANNN